MPIRSAASAKTRTWYPVVAATMRTRFEILDSLFHHRKRAQFKNVQTSDAYNEAVSTHFLKHRGELRGFAAALAFAFIPVCAQEPQPRNAVVEKILIPGVSPPYRPIQPLGRVTWFVRSTVGVQSLAGGVFAAGVRTAMDEPPEYGQRWSGFYKRYGMWLASTAANNAMEGSLGLLWGEDPRYFRATGRPVRQRVKHIVKMTFLTNYTDGSVRPAYARAIAGVSGSYLANTWRAPSESSGQDAALRALFGVLSRMGSNAFAEFWPDVKRRFGRNREPRTRTTP
jgi:hypothetical protein